MFKLSSNNIKIIIN